MLEKITNAYKRNILLRSRFVAIALCFALLLCSFALPASAAEGLLDYNDYIANVITNDGYDTISLKWPIKGCFWERGVNIYQEGSFYSESSSSSSVFFYSPFYYTYGPVRLLKSDIPDDAKFTFVFSCDTLNVPSACWLWLYQYDEAGNLLSSNYYAQNFMYSDDLQLVTLYNYEPLPFHKDCYSFRLHYQFDVNGYYFDGTGNYGYSFSEAYWDISFSVSSAYRQQQQTNKTNNILKEVEKQLAEQGKTLDEVLQQQQQTNDKLDGIQGGIDDTNDKLETLPGEIGDEMQGIIDNEKEESKSEGNKFVDQILDALPDPSTDVLAALKGLTDATAYTGTDAVLPIPAIVLPGIDGLFPQTEIWGGTQFDFGEYIGMLPPALLTLVQSLFTIAIVLFCVYELKGIISYCLTLRENKGG